MPDPLTRYQIPEIKSSNDPVKCVSAVASRNFFNITRLWHSAYPYSEEYTTVAGGKVAQVRSGSYNA